MTVTDCVVGEFNTSVNDLQDKSSGERKAAGSNETLGQLAALSVLCNEAELDAAQADVPIAQRNIFGDATDTAILRFAETFSAGNVGYFRGCWERVFELAFNSKNKFMIRCLKISRREGLGQTIDTSAAAKFGDGDM